VLYGGVRLKTILNVLLVVASVKGYPKEAGHGKRKLVMSPEKEILT